MADHTTPGIPDGLPSDSTASYIPPAVAGGVSETEATAPASVWQTATDPTPGAPSEPSGPTYRFQQLLGRGGMGEVWEALQVSLGRVVAVKRMRATGGAAEDSASRRRSFQQEAVIAARLEHPNIVPVHDLGAAEDGSPLLAMKLVNGEPWDRLLRSDFKTLNAESLIARHVPVLLSVAQAVAFAHSRGVIHRDLKPAQVMVGAYGEVQLMDWGLALLLEGPAAAVAPLTPTGALPSPATASNPAGTPALMAPEQTEHDASGIGPWTDVFLLGGTLYFILSGTYPHAAEHSREAFAQARACQIEPPSKRASNRWIPEDLERLCMRSLAKAPQDRPASALEFVAALQDVLSGASRRRESDQLVEDATQRLAEIAEPGAVLSPAGRYAAYAQVAEKSDRALQLWPGNENARSLRRRNLAARLRDEIAQGDLLLARLHLDELRAEQESSAEAEALARALDIATERRNRARRMVRLLSVAALSLLLATGVLAWRSTMARADAARADARRREQQALQEQLSRIDRLRSAEVALATELDRALPMPSVRDLTGDPERRRQQARREGPSLLSRIAELSRERESIRGGLLPGLRLDPRPFALVIGEANLIFHADDDSSASLRALERYEQAFRSEPQRAEPYLAAGIAAIRAGQYVSATALLDRAAARTAEMYGPGSAAHAEALAAAAEAYRKLDASSVQAIRRFEESLAILEPRWLETTEALARSSVALSRFDEAIAYTSATLAIAEDFPAGRRLALVQTLQTGAEALRNRTRYAESEAHLRRALDIARADYGAESAHAAAALDNLGEHFFAIGDPAKSEPIFREALSLREKALGADSAEAGESAGNLGSALLLLRNVAEAEPYLLRALASDERHYGPDHPETARRIHNLAYLHMQTGRLPEALAALDRVHRIASAAYGAESADAAIAMNGRAVVLDALGRGEEAEPLLREVLRIQEKLYGEHHPLFAGTTLNFARFLFLKKRYEECIPFYEQAIAIHLALGGDGRRDAPTNLHRLANAHMQLKRNERALEVLERAMALLAEDNRANEMAAVPIRHDMAKMYRSLDREADAERELRATVAIFDGDAPEFVAPANTLISLLEGRKAYDEIIPLAKRIFEIREKQRGPTAPATGNDATNLGSYLYDAGRNEEAETILRRAVAIFEQAPAGNGRENAPFARRHLVNVLLALGRDADALAEARTMHREMHQYHGTETLEAGSASATLGAALLDSGNREEATMHLRTAMELFRKHTATDTAIAKRTAELLGRIEAEPAP